MGHLEHKSDSNAKKSLNIFVITLSDTRNKETDESGIYLKNYLTKNNHVITGYTILKDDKDLLQKELVNICAENFHTDVNAVIINGGTGISQRDYTYESVSELYDKEIYGFGELCRYLSFEEIGTASIMSRASCGIYNNKIIFSIPGSLNAVKLATEKIIIKEIGHIYYEITK